MIDSRPNLSDEPTGKPRRNPLGFAVFSLASGALPWLTAVIAYAGEAKPDRGKADMVQTMFLFGSIVAIVSGAIALNRSMSPSHEEADRRRNSIALAAAVLGLALGGSALFLLFAYWDQYM